MVCSNRFDVPSLRLIYSVVDVVCANVVRVSDAYTINDWGGGCWGVYLCGALFPKYSCHLYASDASYYVWEWGEGDKRWCVLEKRHGHRRLGRITFYEGMKGYRLVFAAASELAQKDEKLVVTVRRESNYPRRPS